MREKVIRLNYELKILIKNLFRLDTDDKTNPDRIINQLDYMESKLIDKFWIHGRSEGNY